MNYLCLISGEQGSTGRTRGKRNRPNLDDTEGMSYQPRQQEVDANYIDPLGPQMERPKTAAKVRNMDDEFADEELGEDLLPE